MGRNKSIKGNLLLVYSWFYHCCGFVVYYDMWTVSVRAYWCRKWEKNSRCKIFSGTQPRKGMKVLERFGD